MKFFLRFEVKTVDPHINVRVYNEPKKAGDSKAMRIGELSKATGVSIRSGTIPYLGRAA